MIENQSRALRHRLMEITMKENNIQKNLKQRCFKVKVCQQMVCYPRTEVSFPKINNENNTFEFVLETSRHSCGVVLPPHHQHSCSL